MHTKTIKEQGTLILFTVFQCSTRLIKVIYFTVVKSDKKFFSQYQAIRDLVAQVAVLDRILF